MIYKNVIQDGKPWLRKRMRPQRVKRPEKRISLQRKISQGKSLLIRTLFQPHTQCEYHVDRNACHSLKD